MNKHLFVELDALLDTRLGTLIQMDPNYAKAVLSHGYRQRLSDTWSELGVDIDQSLYQTAYQQRDRHTLAHSRPTDVITLLAGMVTVYGRRQDPSDVVEKVTLTLNLYPYHLNHDEQEAIINAIMYYIDRKVDYELVYLSAKEITPLYLKQHISGMVLYDFNRWLEANIEALKATPIPTVVCMIPALYNQRTPTKEDITYDLVGEISPFASLELIMTEYLSVQCIDSALFSYTHLGKQETP